MLHIHRSERADVLVEALGAVLVAPLEDAMQPEVVAVPSRGVERWLTQSLSSILGTRGGRADGVCANIDFPFPGGLVGQALSSASGVDPEADPWLPERSVWPLLEVVDAHLSEAWLAPLAGHLEHAAAPGEERRFATVRHIADLYDRYGIHRPEMLRAWADGEDLGTTPQSRWQALLWRHLREHIGVPSPPERLAEACRALREDPGLAELPERFSLFGLTRLAASYLDILGALAAGREVHLFALHPSGALWQRLAGYRAPRGLRRAEDPTVGAAVNPLLGSWGRDAREMQLVLGATDDPFGDEHRPVTQHEAPSLLQRIQEDIYEDRAPVGEGHPGAEDLRPVLDDADRSVQIHACHGRGRQVEVLRDAALHLLEQHPDMEARDVIVMCPDIEAFAPFIDAVFGAADPEADEEEDRVRLPDLRVRMADRSLRQTNPVLAVVAELLRLATARVTASEVLDLASRDPVRRRFGFDDDDLTRLEEWVVGSGIRWGLDSGRRAPYKLAELAANTWRAGLDRLLVGVAMADEGERLVGGVLPFDDVDSGDIALAGRLAEFVDRLDAAVSALGTHQGLEGWVAAIAQAADSLTETSERDRWQRQQLQRLLDDLMDEGSARGTSEVVLDNGDVVSLLSDRLRGRPTRANFRTGALTICTLVPMRSVPHRVVCLLGLDDGAFPRGSDRDGDDLILGDPYVGDRDPRSEDRQLMLDAVLAAGEHLVITYTGRDERSNQERPPAVPVGELLDVIERTVRTEDGSRVRDRVVVEHPLQPFDVRNFAYDGLTPGLTWGFDPVGLEAAVASTGRRERRPPFLPGPLPDPDTTTIELDDLERFLRHPVGAFLRTRLGVRRAQEARDVDDALPVELDALERWAVGERLVSARMGGAPLEACLAAERARGVLPPGVLAERILSRLVPDVEAIVAAAALGAPATSLDVNAYLDDGTHLVGTVSGIHGDLIRLVTFSRLGPNHRLQNWVRLLAMTLARPERPFEALTVGRLRESGKPGCSTSLARLATLGSDPGTRHDAAAQQLGVLVDLYRRGMREPLPLYCKTSAAWAKGAPPKRHSLASKQWTSQWEFPREDAEPEHVLVLGGKVGFDGLLEEAPRADEDGDGWAGDEDTRFGRYAVRLWAGLLGAEAVSDQ